MAPSREITIVARVFVFLVYAGLAASFVASTAALVHEFRDTGWFDFATTDSHLFLFFPTLGVVALAAFYLPSCALVDLYWRYVPFGKLRFLIGTLALAGLSYLIAHQLLQSPKRSMWELTPAALQADQGVPAGCAQSGTCERLPALLALQNLRRVSQSYFGLDQFVRNCQHDNLLELRPGPETKRFCFASTPLSQSPPLQTDDECCRAQELLSGMISTEASQLEQRSLTGKVHAWLLPFKVFFLLVLLAISVLLVSRHKAMQQHYQRSMPRIEFAVIIGTLAVLFFPLMSQAFVQSTEVLYGLRGRGTFSLIMPALSLAFGAWTLLMVFFFYRRRDKELEAFAKMGSALAGAIAVLNYSIVTAVLVRFLGSGATMYTVGALVAVSLIAVIAAVWPRVRLPGGTSGPTPSQAEPAA